MRYETPHTIEIAFDFEIRNDFVRVEAVAWHDDEGIYKTRISDVLIDEVSVIGILTPDDLIDIDSAIEPAILADAGERRATGSDTIPGPIPTR